MSPVFDDHDYVSCRSSKAVAVKDQYRRSNVQPETDGPEPKTASREVNAFWKVGHDARRKLCIVGFNWNSSQLRLNKLGAGKTAASPSVFSGDGRMKPKDKSARSRMVLTSGESAETAATISGGGASCDRPEVVKGVGQEVGSGTKRRSKVYIYKPPPCCTDREDARSTTAKPVALVNKPTRRKTSAENISMPDMDETSSAVESIMPPADRRSTPEVSAPPPPPKRPGEYKIQLSSTGPSKPSAKKALPDYGYLSSFLREPGSSIISPGCEAMSAAAAVSLQQIVEGGVPTSTTLSTAPLGVPSPFLLQTGLEQALGFAAFHPMSPSTSSSSCSRVAGDEWPNNDDDDLAGRPETYRASGSTMMPPESWIGDSDRIRSHYDEACGAGDATGLYSAADFPAAATSQPEPVFLDDLSTPFSDDGDLRYASSSFVVCGDNWDGYQREEQIDDCWSQTSQQFPPDVAAAPTFGGRKSAASRFRFADSGAAVAAFGGGGSGFGRSGGRSDRRRKQSAEDRRNRKSGAVDDVAAIAGNDRPDAVSASKRSYRQRTYGDVSKRPVQSTDVAHTQSDAAVDVDHADAAQKTSANRRRKQPSSSRKKYASVVDNLGSETSDVTPKTEGASKKRAQSKSSRGQLDIKLKTQTSAVCYLIFNLLKIE